MSKLLFNTTVPKKQVNSNRSQLYGSFYLSQRPPPYFINLHSPFCICGSIFLPFAYSPSSFICSCPCDLSPFFSLPSPATSCCMLGAGLFIFYLITKIYYTRPLSWGQPIPNYEPSCFYRPLLCLDCLSV